MIPMPSSRKKSANPGAIIHFLTSCSIFYPFSMFSHMAIHRFILLCCCLAISMVEVWAQKTCGTVDYQHQLKQQAQLESAEAFESWMSDKLLELRLKSGTSFQSTRVKQVLTIPVVIHIIHNGESVGSGSNIHDIRVMEQIDRLNDDFRRMNSDTLNAPPEFRAVAADTEIEFVLAQRDPHGLPTTGINRVLGTRPVYDLVHNTELKALSYWPAEEYMNLWVAQLDNLLGYAQFPVSTLGGLESASENRLTDGVVIDSDFFGNNPGLTPESIGRTCTHEVGHYLGLRHVWGDGGCSVDDFCDDTPRSNSSNFGCPNANSCGSDDMVQNYMDLSDDLCMNLFTVCQKSRMRVVLSNSPRRASLLTSLGGTPPVMVDNDAGIREIAFPKMSNCQSMLSPSVTIQNTGTNVISSVSLALLVDNVQVETQSINQELELLETTTVSFGEVSVIDGTEIAFAILETNGTTDGNQENNQKAIITNAQDFNSLPISEEFGSFPASWEIRNSDNDITWELVNAPAESPSNTAVGLNFFNYRDFVGEYDYLITPALDASSYTGLSLQFDVAHAQFSPNDQDGLIVAVSTDCGNTFSTMDYVYQKQGTVLATAPISGSSFIPSSRSQWRTESVDLNQYAGIDQLQIAFIGINDFGNNLYLDNVEIFGIRKPDIDLALSAINSPALVSCLDAVTPEVLVTNVGLQEISGFELSYTMSSGVTDNIVYEGPSIPVGEEVLVSFSEVPIAPGAGTITATIEQVNGQGGDGNVDNNSLEQPFIIDTQQDLIPKIETFETPLAATDWQSLDVDGVIGWTTTGTSQGDNNQAAFMNFFNYDRLGELDYLVTPILDFSGAINPTLTFDLAYAGNSNFNDGLLILGSSDCGATYSDTLFAASGLDLATVISNTEFFPQVDSDWVLQQLDLTSYAGVSGVRLAFVGVNDFGNNLFIDNVQFFLTDQTKSLDLEPGQMIVFPNPTKEAFFLTFNLAERSAINLEIVDPMGRVVWQRELTDVLNQSFEFNLPYASGIYVLQATGNGFKAVRRIIKVQ